MLQNLARFDDPILRTPTEVVNLEDFENIRSIIPTMFNIIDLTKGIGLAAPQVKLNKSMFVINIENTRKIFINPHIISVSKYSKTEWEGCLSLMGLELKIARPEAINATWTNEEGHTQVADLEGLWARCWLHEYDHLQGILIDDRVSKLALDIAKRKLAKKIKQFKDTHK